MFDSVPPNLPVDPTQVPPPPPPPQPPFASPVISTMSASPTPSPKGQKEPEDIFSELDQSRNASTESVAVSSMPFHHGKSPMLIVGGVLLGLLVLAGVGFVVWTFVINPSGGTVSQSPVVLTTTPVEQVEQPPVIDQNSQPVTQPPVGAAIPSPIINQPSTGNVTTGTSAPTSPSAASAIVEGKDSDADVLTDVEEAFYGTDPLKSDTDGDGYPDGSEAMNLFSPLAKGKALAAESFMLLEKWNGVSFLLPKPWSLVFDVSVPDHAAVTTGSATRITFDLRANPTRANVIDWLANPEQAKTLVPLKTKEGFDALQTPDGLLTYIPLGDNVLVVAYDVNGDTSYEYRSSYRMILNSLTSTVAK